MFTVGVRSNAKQVAASFEASGRQADKALEAALNRAAELVNAAAPGEIRKAGYGFPVGEIPRALRIERAGPGRLVARVIATGRPIALIKFNARASSSGVSVEVLNGRKTIPGAFIARMPSGHEGVFVRDGRRQHPPRNRLHKWADLPVRELFGPSVPNGLANAKVQAALRRLVEQRFPGLFNEALVKPSSRR